MVIGKYSLREYIVKSKISFAFWLFGLNLIFFLRRTLALFSVATSAQNHPYDSLVEFHLRQAVFLEPLQDLLISLLCDSFGPQPIKGNNPCPSTLILIE
jgi:hypothetical protein